MEKKYTKEFIDSLSESEKINLAKKRIENVMVQWYIDDPIMLGAFCLVDKIPDKTQKTVGINTKTNPAKITFNPNFILSLSEERLEFVLVQEGFKILLRHPTTRINKPENIAATASTITVSPMSVGSLINIQGMEDFFMTPEKFGFPPNKYFEDYFRRLMDQQDNTDSTLEKMFGSAESSSGEDGDGESFQEFNDQNSAMKEYMNPNSTNTKDWSPSELFESEIKSLVDDHRGSAKNWGKYTGNSMGEILAANTPKISWKEVVRRFARSVMSRRTVPSRMRVNRRHDTRLPGSRREYDTKIVFAVDVSGSMSDKILQEGFSVINSVSKHAEVTYIQFDTEIKKTEKNFKKARESFTILGRGGTDFNCLIDYVDQNKYDGLVIFTDGYASAPKQPIKTKVLWLLHSKDQKPPVTWGNIAHIDLDEA
jgi:predicted metal-dependent peptidase